MEWWKRNYVAARIVFKYLYLTLLQKLYWSVVHIRKNTYEIQYALHDRVYRVRTRTRRGPSQIVCVRDQCGEDITEELRSYLGPNEDFHGQTFRPCDMGCEEVRLLLRDGTEKVCKAGECIAW
jgi:hypothetical protein